MPEITPHPTPCITYCTAHVLVQKNWDLMETSPKLRFTCSGQNYRMDGGVRNRGTREEGGHWVGKCTEMQEKCPAMRETSRKLRGTCTGEGWGAGGQHTPPLNLQPAPWDNAPNS
uniref:Uncharacterized protein n=1 Tax=Eutreptiella gymnastica TaxID=73025 RepID=A0A7S4D035_9EUGL